MLVHLRDIIADYYPTEADARRLVAEVGLPSYDIAFDEKSINTSWSIVVRAQQLGLLEKLVKTVQAHYPDNMELTQMLGVFKFGETPVEYEAPNYRTDYRNKSQAQINEDIYSMIRENTDRLGKLMSEVAVLKAAVFALVIAVVFLALVLVAVLLVLR